MWSSLRQLLIASSIPGGLIFLVAIAFLRPHGLPDWVETPIAVLPVVVLAFGVIFGWYFASSRLILSLLVISLAECSLYVSPASSPDQSVTLPTILAFTAFLLPLNLLALSLIQEDTLSVGRSLVRLSLILAQPILVMWLSRPSQADLALTLQQPFIPLIPFSWTPLSQQAFIVLVGTCVLLLFRFAVDRDPLDAGAAWAVITSFAAFHGVQYGWAPINFLSAAGLILFLTHVQSSYRRTYCDALTGCSGRPAYEEAVATLGQRYVIAVAGIDQLKQYSNQHGKAVGEQLLRLIGPKLVTAARPGKVFRLAGEEFTILFPGKSTRDTLAPLDNVRKAIERSAFFLRGRDRVWAGDSPDDQSSRDQILAVTLSIGVAQSIGSQDTPQLVTKSAYRALYEAKGEGGNQVKRDANSSGIKRTAYGVGRIISYSELGT